MNCWSLPAISKIQDIRLIQMGGKLTVLPVQMACADQGQDYYWLSENKGRNISLDPTIESVNLICTSHLQR